MIHVEGSKSENDAIGRAVSAFSQGNLNWFALVLAMRSFLLCVKLILYSGFHARFRKIESLRSA